MDEPTDLDLDLLDDDFEPPSMEVTEYDDLIAAHEDALMAAYFGDGRL